ncbi:crotonase/enoyl-CoA hydratase family protein [Eilatimonas milleporae]|uniref:Enoyl-CoA hydratase/carnithine racemase n=1 Tax=Eilatimonas milleporae TaxID=911205 RepID=A0A3M0CG94_9PROT|nr:crotonase/enoyl-CoA hydratase family protein [Eilatimonas milleporae]RMB08621.1 enoyl-CoA hydratase/carnithine racemase [Eilatimonas milleporae]
MSKSNRKPQTLAASYGPNAELLAEVSDDLAVFRLNRPAKLNALSYALVDALLQALGDAETSDTVRAVILTGSGGRAFSAGADIAEFSGSVERGRAHAVRDFVRRGQSLTARIEGFPKPVIAAVGGLAYGGGCEITEAAHLAVAGRSAVFSKSEILLGMPPTFGGTQRLPRTIGRKRGLEWLLTGDVYSAAQAHEAGLVNAVVEDDGVLDAARALAGRITRHHGDAVAAVLSSVSRGLNVAIDEGLQIERQEFAALVGSACLDEGLARWLHRRSGNDTDDRDG